MCVVACVIVCVRVIYLYFLPVDIHPYALWPVPITYPRCIELLFYEHISRTSAVSSTNFGSILIFASCVVGTCNILDYVGEFFHNGRGHIILERYQMQVFFLVLWVRAYVYIWDE